jgi:hypothetical protein
LRQSINLEVQERASTLRYLLADFDILAMNWQAAAEEVARDESAATSSIPDLLDLPVYTAGSVNAVDTQGSSIAKAKANVLSAITGEAFYAVHTKAQRKVRVPDGLDLAVPFNGTALTKLLNVEIPHNLTLSTLSFAASVHPNLPDYPGAFAGEDDPHIGKFPGSSSAEGRGPVSYSSFQGDNSAGPSAPSRNVEDNLFYLSSAGRGNADIIPLSQVLADTFEDRKSKKGKGKRTKKPKSDEIDTREMLPAGAVSSDDEKGGAKKKKDKGSVSRYWLSSLCLLTPAGLSPLSLCL